MRLFIILLTTLLPLLVSAQTKTWKSDCSHSRMGFSVKHLGLFELSGFFSDFEATVVSDKEDLSDMKVDLCVKLASVNTGSEARDNHLKAKDFFYVEKFQEMTFVSSKVEKIDDCNAKLYGNLTFCGTSKPIELHVTHNGTVTNPMDNKLVAGFKVTGAINRKDFDLGTGFADNLLSDEVQISIDIEFNPVP